LPSHIMHASTRLH